MEVEQEPVAEPKPQTVPKNKGIKSKVMMALTAIVLLIAGAAGGYMYRDKIAKDQAEKSQAEITSLQAKVTKLEKDVIDAQKSTSTTSSSSTAQSKSPSASVLENIQASITSGNTAALEGYMASSVKVILAASEGVGDRTPTQAIGDLKYLDSATAPWDFALPAATITKYQAGDYKQYFPTTALVGKSANNYVISFQFDSNAKISGIFMAANASLL